MVMTAGMALRELWISFRLLVVLGLFVTAGVLAAMVPLLAAGGLVAPGTTATWYAFAFAVAAAGSAALGAAAFGGERLRGGLAWMAARAVPRSLLLLGWFAALVMAVLAGLVPSAALAWLSLASEAALDARAGWLLGFGVTVAAATADAMAWISAGLLAGTLLPPRLASALTLLFVAGLLVLAMLAPATTLAPAGGVELLAEYGAVWPSLTSGLQAIGAALVWTAVLLVVAMAALARRDL